MAKYAVNEEGIAALRTVGEKALEAISTIYNGSIAVISLSEDQSDLLGPHKGSLISAVKEILTSLKAAAEPISDIADTLNDVAEAYEEILSNDIIETSGNSEKSAANGSGQQGGSGKGGSFLGRIFGSTSGNSTGKGSLFDGLPTGQFQNGDTVVKGANFEQFISDYYNSENSTFESLGDDVIVENVSPSMIEGIHLGNTEVKDPSVFWGMHASSKEFFIETASHIPAVKAALDSGRSLSDIKNDPTIGTCASIYFDPANIPRVEKCRGYYTFDGDGRHRILAARELGYDIPVCIVGIRHYK